MAKKESENILDKVHKIEKDIHFYKTELLSQRPKEYVEALHKLISMAEANKRQLIGRAHQLEHKEELEEIKAQKILKNKK
ncbi:MAG: hypothetical protein HYS02_01970 [Candidatus Staskawiczbacteria bacterium]|nr:hypothetical protein [Candidatus Staskawiczbacteria bacterium]